MAEFWKKSLGMGLGAGLLGAAVVALRRGLHPLPQPSLPDIISPAVFARRVQRTTRGQVVYHMSGEGEPLVFLHDFLNCKKKLLDFQTGWFSRYKICF